MKRSYNSNSTLIFIPAETELVPPQLLLAVVARSDVVVAAAVGSSSVTDLLPRLQRSGVAWAVDLKGNTYTISSCKQRSAQVTLVFGGRYVSEFRVTLFSSVPTRNSKVSFPNP